jgi:hypothetical protein
MSEAATTLMKQLDIIDMLRLCGFDPDSVRAKIVRHKEDTYPVERLLENGWLDAYQSYQGKPRFDKVDVIVSLYGLNGTRSCFYGVFKVVSRRPGSEGTILPNCPWVHEWREKCPYFYELERLPGYEALEHRLVVDWGKVAISWHQKLSSKLPNKPVLELLAAGRRLPIFGDYLEFSLSHQQLKDLYQHPEAHQDWRSALKAVAGVYLILAEETGEMYVGSAYGAGGVWGRWEQYSKTGHGGNVRLEQLLAQDARYPGGFRFSLLHVLPKTLTREEVIKRETRYKLKLGSRAIGLNGN